MSAQRVAQWLWWSGSPPARVARGVLLPFAMVYRTYMTARAAAYKRHWLRRRPLALPSVAIGNLAVGGAGKTPVAAWTAAFFARHGLKPGILLRGYRGDEQAVHQRLVPEAVVVADDGDRGDNLFFRIAEDFVEAGIQTEQLRRVVEALHHRFERIFLGEEGLFVGSDDRRFAHTARFATPSRTRSTASPFDSQRTASSATSGSGAPAGQRRRSFTASFSVTTT